MTVLFRIYWNFDEILYCSWSTIKPNISLDFRSFSNILNGVSHEMKWAMKLSRFSWRRFESCFLNFLQKFATWKRILFWPVTFKFNHEIGQISNEKIKMTFLRQVQSFNNLLKRLKTKVALFVTVHNDSIFLLNVQTYSINCLTEFWSEWVSNWSFGNGIQ